MPSLVFKSKYELTEKQVISVSEVRSNYLYGISLEKDGKALPDSVIESYIKSASVMVEDLLHIKLKRTPITESRDFFGDDWMHWNFQKWSYPISCIVSLEGYRGSVRQVRYPRNWLSVRQPADTKYPSRILHMVPNQNAQQNDQLIYSGIMPQLSSYGTEARIPNYWTLKYITGFKGEIPEDLKMFIGKFAALNTLVLANSFLQKVPGQASSSISLDGLSQSISMAVQNGIFASTIKQYGEELEKEKQRLFDYYAAISMITA